MDIRYTDPGFGYSIDSIFLFQTEDETPFWTDSLYYFYPQLDKARMTALSPADRRAYVADTLQGVYEQLQPELARKAQAYTAHWQDHRPQVEAAFSEAFETDTRLLFNDLQGRITLNPVCPRFLQEHAFDVFHLNSERGALGISLHEMIHFLWFRAWNDLHHDSRDDYERPHMKWILSEMVVESIMRDPRLSSINPYFPREHGGCVYPYFQDMVLEGHPALDTLDAMYRQRDGIRAFMAESYAWCLHHEAEIRAHIQQAEQTF